MKTLMAVCLMFGLCFSALALAQGAAQQSDQTKQPSAQKQPTGDQTISGTVSADGKTFTSDKDNKSYKVSNPEALKGQEGQHVAVLVHVDPDTGAIQITSLQPAPKL